MTARPIQPEDGDPRHGTPNGYSNLKCRCELCRKASSEYLFAYQRARRGRLEPDDPRHGTPGGYTNWGCRCTECRAGNAAQRRAYYARIRDQKRAAKAAAQ